MIWGGVENISGLNPYFCELTAGYWIYKNDSINDYIGLYHYSRGLDMSDRQIENIVASGVDVVLPFPDIFRWQMSDTLDRDDLRIILEVIENVSSQYTDSARDFFQNKQFFPGNIVFAKKKIFCQYYEWMFKILWECRKIKADGLVQERLWGYYAEYLTNIFFRHHMEEYGIVLCSKMKFFF